MAPRSATILASAQLRKTSFQTVMMRFNLCLRTLTGPALALYEKGTFTGGAYVNHFASESPERAAALLAVRDAVAKLGPRALNADPPLVSKRLGAAVLDRLSEARFSLHDAVVFRERKSIVSPDALMTIKDPLTQAILQLEVVKHPRRETVPVALFAPSQNPRLVAEGKATYGSWLKATPKPQFDESQRATPGELPAVLYRGVRHPSDVSKRSPAQVTHAHDTFAAAQKGIALAPPKYNPDFGAATFTNYWAGSLGEARGYAGAKGIVLALETAGLESSFAVTPASDTKGADFEARGFASYVGVRRVGPGEQK